MNERIKELGDQAWDYALDHETVNGKAAFGSFINKNFSDLLLEKFAELIVRECCQLIDDATPVYSLENLQEDYCQGNLDGYRSALLEIKEHFGVEE